MAVSHLTKNNFKKEVLEDKGVVFVDFYADWCGPCQMVGPIIEQLSEDNQYKGRIKFVKVNVDLNQELAGQYNIFSIPTFIIFKQGRPIHQFTGAMGKEGLEQEINKVIRKG